MMAAISAAGGMPDFSRMQEMRQQRFSQADGDGSGALSLDEFKGLQENSPMAKQTSDAEQLFGQLDGDGDGQLTQTELDEGMKALMSAMSTQDFARMGPAPGGPPPGGPPPSGPPPGSTETADTDSESSATSSATSNSEDSRGLQLQLLLEALTRASAGSASNSLALVA